jgi:hypothetical protein
MFSKLLNKSVSSVSNGTLRHATTQHRLKSFSILNSPNRILLRNHSTANTLVIDKMPNATKIVRVHEAIKKSSNDSRTYRGLELDNGMKCLLISDPKTDRSAASVDVHIGNLKTLTLKISIKLRLLILNGFVL